MSVLSLTCCSLFSAVCAFTLVSATGCGTDAQGIDDCRQIEQARCAAAKNCGIISDIPACQRFYRDQCLHGLPVAPPGSVKLQACVTTIQAAGMCATQGVDTVCNLVKEPEKASECSFLMPGVDAGAGGASSSGGSGNAGSAGAEASAGGDDGS